MMVRTNAHPVAVAAVTGKVALAQGKPGEMEIFDGTDADIRKLRAKGWNAEKIE